MKSFTGTVAVTGLNATDNPGPGVAVISALRSDPRFQGRIVGLAYDALDPGLYAPGLVDAAFLIPYPSAGRQALLHRLAYIQEQVGIDVLLPNLDSELPSMLDQEQALLSLGIRCLLPTRRSFEARAKANLDRLRADHGINVPPSETLVEVGALYDIHERLDFPLVIKSPFYGAEVVHSTDEAVRAFHRAAAKWGLPIIAQQFVKGEEVNVVALGDGQGGLVGAVAMKKTLITDKGKGWAGVAIRDPALLDFAADVVRATRWRGPCEVEALRDADGVMHLVEVNPRFPAWCDLAPHAGQNLVLAALHMAMGEQVAPMRDYQAGAGFVRISVNQMVSIQQLAEISTQGQVLPDPEEQSA